MSEDSARAVLEAWERMLGWLPEADLARTLGLDVTPRLLGRLLALVGMHAPRFAELEEIPSETEPTERGFLYAFFARRWCGRGNVVEIGPFLGGTTRAIALGMLQNPARERDASLYTFDRFESYHDRAGLERVVSPLVARGVLSPAVLETLGEGASFLDVFERVHSGRDYSRLVVATRCQLRSSAADPVPAELRFALPAELRCSAALVDGCKSWFATREFMAGLAPRLEPGAALIFQDYGWYTCFWIAALVELLGDRLELFAHVHHTYAFRLVRPTTASEIEARFPETPEALGRDGLDALFETIGERAAARDDVYGLLVSRLHRAAALAYIGELDEARAEFRELLGRTGFRAHRSMIEAAAKSPTYRPDGPVSL